MIGNQPFDAQESQYHYIIGIDLGTTNSALAYVRLRDEDGSPGAERKIRFLEIPQLTRPGELARLRVLPSFLYIPGPYDLPPGSTALPWDPERKEAVGEFAREQGALVPGRLVSSAKSWLAHGGVDRTSPILPWGESSVERKVSPVEAAARYLDHIREAWNHTMAKGREEHALENQLVVITVPASFDEVARELTVVAGRQAGIPRFVLLEEPLAAFYAWVSRHQTEWQARMKPGEIILVCDVGGGTTDFTAVAVREGEKGLRFDRLAVGDHLILGGDNMDLALGRMVEQRLVGKSGKLETRRWHQLVHQCRKAKELMLQEPGDVPSTPVTLVGTGGKLIASTLKTSLTKDEVRDLVMEGFFPRVGRDELPREERRTGLTEWGLPYVQDAAVTRHLAAFWKRFRELLRKETGREHPFPDFLLFNGGALGPLPIRTRILDTVAGWFRDAAGAGWAPRELDNPYPELAVAVGAAYYGLVRVGEGTKVGAGSPRSYYVEVAGGGRPGNGEKRVGVCVVPRGAEDGYEARLESPAFEVLTNQPVSFRLFSSATRLGDRMGDICALSPEEISVFPPIRTALGYGKKARAERLPVRLGVKLTAIGTLELWCESLKTPHRWQLQFDVRQERDFPSGQEAPAETLEQTLIDKALERVRAVFGGEAGGEGPSPEPLVKELEEILGVGRQKWSTPLSRTVADSLLASQEGRKFSPQHEARWFNLLGFCLRPGFGAPGDEWRMNEAWKVFLRGTHWPTKDGCRMELWIFLRRVSGGFNAGRQLEIYREISPALRSPGAKKSSGRIKLPKRLSGQEETEIWMVLANCERLPVEEKRTLGRILLEGMRKKARPQEYWALGRFGSRVPLYGPLNRIIPGKEVSSWLSTLLAYSLPPKEAVARSLVQLAMRTGDRERDVGDEERRQVSAWLERVPRPEPFQELLKNEGGCLGRQDQEWMFGETLPSGLVLTGSD